MTILYSLRSALFLGIVFALTVVFRYRREKAYSPKGDNPLYPPRTAASGIAIFLLILFFFDLLYTPQLIFIYVFSKLFSLTWGIVLLIALLPLMRKTLHPESCATLWVILCFVAVCAGDYPIWIISLPFPAPGASLRNALFWVWLLGAVAVFSWHILSHFHFRRRILQRAHPVEDAHLQEEWAHQLHVANLSKNSIRLWISPDVHTPLSIGLFWRTTCLVLPQRDYSREEAALIFRHELIHISRGDSTLKMEMLIMTALMWFNPLVWIWPRICSEDLELSCDEAVLYGCSMETRKKYAFLLLQTASPAQGFTTCLCGAERSMRYRLKSVVNPRNRKAGSLIIGILCAAMVFCAASTGVRFQSQSAKDFLFAREDISQLRITGVITRYDGIVDSGEYVQPQQILDYICALDLHVTRESPELYDYPDFVQIVLRSANSSYMLTFAGTYLRVYTITFSGANEGATTLFYQLDCELDWQLLNSYTPS